MPVDADPVAEGNFYLVPMGTELDAVIKAEPVSKDEQATLFEASTRERYTSHFATCPQAQNWRQR